MAKFGPIIIVEDDIDDQEVIEMAIKETGIGNEIIFLNNGEEALHFLRTTLEQPFIILSDVNMPKVNGIELKQEIDEDRVLRKKSIPFVYFSTSVDKATVNEAYTKMSVQGFFQKSEQYKDLVRTLKLIMDYWKVCKHPNSN